MRYTQFDRGARAGIHELKPPLVHAYDVVRQVRSDSDPGTERSAGRGNDLDQITLGHTETGGEVLRDRLNSMRAANTRVRFEVRLIEGDDQAPRAKIGSARRGLPGVCFAVRADNDAVHVHRALRADIAVRYIGSNRCGTALERVAVAAASGRVQHQHVARSERE